MKIDFPRLAGLLLSDIRQLLPNWLPGGKAVGHEFECGDISGGTGKSLKVNLVTGKWCDFAANQKGGDLISLYAAINNLKQMDSAKILMKSYNLDDKAKHSPKPKPKPKPKPAPVVEVELKLIPPPPGTRLPKFSKKPTKIWKYTNKDNQVQFLIARYDLPNEKKSFLPWSWTNKGAWVKKAWDPLRPLLGLYEITKQPTKPILIVEGESCRDAAMELFGGRYNVVTWHGGANAWVKTDWSPIYNKNVLIWPDADDCGINCAKDIGGHLKSKGDKPIKIIDVSDLKKDGWDVGDALKEKWTWEKLEPWAKARVKTDMADDLAQMPLPKQIDKPAPIKKILVEKIVAPIKEKVVTVFAPSDEIPQANSDGQIEKWLGMGLTVNMSGNPHMNLRNVTKAIRHKLKGKIWYDEFHEKHFTTWNSSRTVEWTDGLTLDLTEYLQEEHFLYNAKDDMVLKAVRLAGRKDVRNEPRDWFDTLKWDGISRVEEFLIKYMGTKDSDYERKASLNWWIAMAARIYDPGCKVDNMMILEGQQGTYKSTALSIIGGPWYTEISENVDSKDFFMVLQGKLLVEVGELGSFNKAENEKIKLAITRATDRYRIPYGKLAEDFKRQSVFVGTTNEHNYLKDLTGARRFYPVTVGDIDREGIKRDREQLFAEAVHLYKSGAEWYLMPESAIQEQAERAEVDVWEEAIYDYIEGEGSFRHQLKKIEVTVRELAEKAIGIDLDRIQPYQSKKIGSLIRRIGWKAIKRQKRYNGGAPAQVFKRPNDVDYKGQEIFKAEETPKVKNFAPTKEELSERAPSQSENSGDVYKYEAQQLHPMGFSPGIE